MATNPYDPLNDALRNRAARAATAAQPSSSLDYARAALRTPGQAPGQAPSLGARVNNFMAGRTAGVDPNALRAEYQTQRAAATVASGEAAAAKQAAKAARAAKSALAFENAGVVGKTAKLATSAAGGLARGAVGVVKSPVSPIGLMSGGIAQMAFDPDHSYAPQDASLGKSIMYAPATFAANTARGLTGLVDTVAGTKLTDKLDNVMGNIAPGMITPTLRSEIDSRNQQAAQTQPGAPAGAAALMQQQQSPVQSPVPQTQQQSAAQPYAQPTQQSLRGQNGSLQNGVVVRNGNSYSGVNVGEGFQMVDPSGNPVSMRGSVNALGGAMIGSNGGMGVRDAMQGSGQRSLPVEQRGRNDGLISQVQVDPADVQRKGPDYATQQMADNILRDPKARPSERQWALSTKYDQGVEQQDTNNLRDTRTSRANNQFSNQSAEQQNALRVQAEQRGQDINFASNLQRNTLDRSRMGIDMLRATRETNVANMEQQRKGIEYLAGMLPGQRYDGEGKQTDQGKAEAMQRATMLITTLQQAAQAGQDPMTAAQNAGFNGITPEVMSRALETAQVASSLRQAQSNGLLAPFTSGVSGGNLNTMNDADFVPFATEDGYTNAAGQRISPSYMTGGYGEYNPRQLFGSPRQPNNSVMSSAREERRRLTLRQN